MEVKNCKGCGRLFNYIGGPRMCPVCVDESEKKFFEVKEYIRENTNTEIGEVAEATEVSLVQIKQWVREERLAFSAESGSIIECEKCGVLIVTGKYCQNCKNDMQKNLTSALDKPKIDQLRKSGRERERMRFLDK